MKQVSGQGLRDRRTFDTVLCPIRQRFFSGLKVGGGKGWLRVRAATERLAGRDF